MGKAIFKKKKYIILEQIKHLCNIIYKGNGGNSKMKGFLKKTLGVCLIGLGLGILLVLLLPITGWLFLIGAIVIIVGFIWLAC